MPGLLADDERARIEAALGEADAAMADGRDAKAVNAVRERLEAASEGFARRRMERALLAGMEGKSLAEVEAALADEENLAERRGAHGAEITERR